MQDCYSFVVPAMVKTLVLPLNNIQRGDFEKYYGMLDRTREIRLVDLTPSQGLFNPQGYPHGRILYDHKLRDTYSESLFLQDLEPFRRTFLVFGLVKYDPELSTTELKVLMSSLQREYPNVVSQVIVIFECPEEDQLGQIPGVFKHKGNQGDNQTNMETLVCDITSYFISALSSYAVSYQHMTLRSPGEFQTGNTATGLRNYDTASLEKQKKRYSTFDVNSTTAQDKNRAMRAKGRRNKLMGNFYLLIGRLSDALKEFCDALIILKSSNDCLWMASALEGLAVCIIILTYLDVPFTLPATVHSLLVGRETSTSQLLVSPSSSPRTSFQSVHSTSRNSPSLPTAAPNTIQYSLATVPELISKIYHKVVFYYRLSSASPEDFVPSLVYYESLLRYVKFLTLMAVSGELSPLTLRSLVRGLPLEESGDTIDVNLKAEILAYAQDFSKPEFFALNILDRCRLYDNLVPVYTDLNLHRKRSLLIKQLIDTILPKSTKLSTRDKIVYNSEGIPELLENVLKTFGVDPKTENEFQFQWVSIQKSFLFRCIELCEYLDETESSSNYALFLLKHFRKVLSEQEQRRVFEVVQRLGSNTTSNYWDVHLVENAVPINHSLPSVPHRRSAGTTDNNPIYNPFSKQENEEVPILVQQEVFEATVTFANPYAFEISISEIEFCANDPEFVLETLLNPKVSSAGLAEAVEGKGTVVVKPYSRVMLSIFGIPKSHGSLEIDAIAASVAGCKKQKFQIGLAKVGAFNAKVDGTYGAFTSEDITIQSKTLKFEVIPPQPLLSLVDVTLSNNWVMLLEGESKYFDIILQNFSKTSANELVSTFMDSTVEPLNMALSNKWSLPANEVYEIEYYLTKRPAYKILNKDSLQLIEGLEKFAINMEIIGKRGMKESSICFEYANVDIAASEAFTRKLNIPINVTVYPSIELLGCDIYPILYDLPSFNELDSNEEHWKFLREVKDQQGCLSDYCLLALDVKNSWGQKLQVSLDYMGHDIDSEEVETETEWKRTPAFSSNFAISTGRTKTVLVPVKRIDFCTERLDRPIPGLANKQFIIDKKMPRAEQQFMRAAFWYRLELLRNLRGSWKVIDEVQLDEQGKEGSRFGQIDLRSIRLSSKMVSILEVEKIEIKLRLLNGSGDEVSLEKIALNEFYTVEATVVNRSSVPVKGMFRHVPTLHSQHPSVEKRILFNGVLQRSIGDAISPGSSKSFELGFVVLVRGEYEWGAIFDEMPLSPGQTTFAKGTQHVLRRSLVFNAN
ncbi:unnamed protein product [Kuraishia capsulata CBS 1993]|uniref:Uncharacterized protein n=1 Tax=Kuraishia capsulata CBS 1993 TaxID=1382522 RepID=W6MXZ1_9ASCO|nr:uncharacterized protein KUCA_T00005718001 [Kuraishia capsulata CBS 1993]CDK29725.1 unnamed protein product [Kuraishia capsulata CBS 1993]